MGTSRSKRRRTEASPGGTITKNKLSLERMRVGERMHRRDLWFSLGKAALKWATLLGIAVFGFFSIRELAGKTTVAMLSGLLDLSADRYILGIACVLFGAGFYFERQQRKRVIRGQAPYIKELEQRIDPRRSSSKLLSDGETRDEDRDD